MLSPSAFHLVLQLFEPRPSTPRTGQLIDRRVIAVEGGLLAVACGLLAIARRAGALLRCAPARRTGPRAQLLNPQGVPVGDLVVAVQQGRLGIAISGACVPLPRQLVPLLCGGVSLLRCQMAQAGILLPLSGRSDPRSGGPLVGRLVAAMIPVPLSGSLILVRGILIAVAERLVIVGERLVIVGERLVIVGERLIGLAQVLLGGVWTFVPLGADVHVRSSQAFSTAAGSALRPVRWSIGDVEKKKNQPSGLTGLACADAAVMRPRGSCR